MQLSVRKHVTTIMVNHALSADKDQILILKRKQKYGDSMNDFACKLEPTVFFETAHTVVKCKQITSDKES